jgi:hypothetical protein
VYAGIFKHQKIIPKYENLMVVLCVRTRHIPPYTMLYRHMTVYDSICQDIMVSGFQMIQLPLLAFRGCGELVMFLQSYLDLAGTLDLVAFLPTYSPLSMSTGRHLCSPDGADVLAGAPL